GRPGRRRAGGVRRDGRARPAALHRLPPALRAHLGPPPGRHRGRGGARQEADMTPPLAWYLGLSAVLFAIGVLGVVVRRNVIVIFMAIELMLNAVNLTFVALARSLGSIDGQVIVFFVTTVAAAGAAVVLAVWAALRRPEAGALHDHVYTWIVAGPFRAEAGLRLDALATVMTLVVTGVGFLIHIYSVGYMHGDRGFARYFAYLNLFTTAMLILVLADNLVLLFVGWEGVGLCSYLLIGFWYEKPENAAAGKKAFLV